MGPLVLSDAAVVPHRPEEVLGNADLEAHAKPGARQWAERLRAGGSHLHAVHHERPQDLAMDNEAGICGLMTAMIASVHWKIDLPVI